MSNTIYRGYDIEKQADGSYTAICNGNSIPGYKTFKTEEDAMNKIDAYKRTIARLANEFK